MNTISPNKHATSYDNKAQQRILDAYATYIAKHGKINWSALGRELGFDRGAVRDFILANEQESPKAKSPPINTERTQFNAEGNTATAEWQAGDVKTLEELLAVCKVDLTVWKVDKYICNKWAVGTKNNDGSVTKTPLFQIKAWLVRAVIEPLGFAPVAPIEIHLRASKAAPAIIRKRGSKIHRAVIWPDMQVGHKRDLVTGKLIALHDWRAIDLALQLTRYLQPDRVIWLGDNLDNPDWSTKYLISPEFVSTTQASIVSMAWICAQTRAIDTSMLIDWIAGNHDQRILTAIATNLRQAYGVRPASDLTGPPMFSIERLLSLNKLRITFHSPYPHAELWLNENIRISHGEIVSGQSGKTAAKVAEDARANEIFGHIHRIEMATKTVWNRRGPKTYQAWSFGSLCSIQPGVVPGFKSHQNWQQAIGIIEYEEGDGLFNAAPIQFFNGVAVYAGQRFIARTEDQITEQVIKDMGYDIMGKPIC